MKGLLRRTWLPGLVSLGFILALYLFTLARYPVPGDPTEYTVVAHILGIAHPPGYAFITLLGKLFQILIPIGTIAWRMHLLAAVSALVAVGAALAVVKHGHIVWHPAVTKAASLGGLYAAFSAATSADVWQHAIHANPHILTASFLLVNLYLLTRWWAVQDQDRHGWLLLFGLSAGLGVTHHPLTLFSWPAFALFIVAVRPQIWRQGWLLARLGVLGLLGLAAWLYFPLRSPMEPPLGPSTMNTLNGFLDHVLARGLAESLPFFGLVDQPDRALVFWSLLRLQYGLVTIGLAVLGLYWLWAGGRPQAEHPGSIPGRRANPRHLLFLFGLAFAGNYAFVINLRAQDIMAYLLGPFFLVALLAGYGLAGLMARAGRSRLTNRQLSLLAAAFFLAGPARQLWLNGPEISLADYRQGSDYVAAVDRRFSGRNEQAILLNNWEFTTPLWYGEFVAGPTLDPADVRPIWVGTGGDNPWLERVFQFLPGGPVYVYDYRPEIVRPGFRLRPRGDFYQVVEPGDTSLPPELTPVNAPAGEIRLAGYALPRTAVRAGDYVPLALAFSAPITPADYYVPVITVGELSFPFTTDSHLVTPLWHPGEVIVERFDFALPHDLPAGDYPVRVEVKNLSQDRMTPLDQPLGVLTVTPQADPPRTNHLLANFRQRVGLRGVTARLGLDRRRDAWPGRPLEARPGDVVHLTLEWQSLAPAEESYTVFVHLIDPGNRPLVALDYTPLGGAAPTHLWIPKWLPGQRLLDPYRLTIPDGLAPGTYLIEVGLYEMTGLRRLHLSDPAGNLIGDRFILGEIGVRPGP